MFTFGLNAGQLGKEVINSLKMLSRCLCRKISYLTVYKRLCVYLFNLLRFQTNLPYPIIAAYLLY